MEDLLRQLLHSLSLPEFGLSTLFIVSLISATLLPLGSEPALLGLVLLNPELYWQAIAVATLGNTLGGMISWTMGLASHQALDRYRHSPTHLRALDWLERLGPKACLFSWMPLVGDPLCAVAGWLRFPFWPCAAYMAIGKGLRYLVLTPLLLWIMPDFH